MMGEGSLSWITEEPYAELESLKRQRLDNGLPIYDFSMLNPDMSPPRLLVDRMLEAATKMHHHRYAVSRGVRKLREGFRKKYQQAFQVTLCSESEICACLGTKDAIHQALRVLREKYSKIILPQPCYPAHLAPARLHGFEVSYFQVTEDESRMLAEIAAFLEQGQPSVVLVNFPHNPTGVAVSAEFFEELGKILFQNDSFLLHDFVYGELSYNGQPAASALANVEQRSRVLESYSLSKAYSVPGWRVGALLGSKDLIRKISALKSYVDYGLFLPFQLAAAAALSTEDDLVESARALYQRRIGTLQTQLLKDGWETRSPQGGACVWAKLPQRAEALPVAYKALADGGVHFTPGAVFGQKFACYARFAMVVSEPKITVSCGALRAALEGTMGEKE